MCGISAIISSDPQVRSLIHKMVETQRMRGPDHHSTFQMQRGPVEAAIGHNRLSLVDLSTAGDQPMEGERYVITYNGELYDHLRLRGMLSGYRWKGGSDTETLLAMIETFGIERTLKQLNGMFAFAVWDKRDRVLSMATDPFGIKPLYVYRKSRESSESVSLESAEAGSRESGVFACASSSAALLHLQKQWKVDRQAIANYFHLGGAAGVWQGIDRLPGGTLARYDANTGKYTQERWYTPNYWEGVDDDTMKELLRDAIRITSRADVPVGIFFSGGIDTSIIASEHRGAHAFHLDGPEKAYAEQGAARFDLQLHVVPNNAHREVEALQDIARKSGEPTMAGHIPWIVSEHAAQYVKACISGNGADELFFGYDRTAVNAAGIPTMNAHLYRDQKAYGGMAPHVDRDALPDDRFGFDAQTRWTELQQYILHDLNPTLDAASMCHSLEMRVPFLEVRVVEAALSMPAAVHGRKRILKDMLLATGLPKGFVDRPKHGFSMSPGNAWRSYAENAWKQTCTRYGMNAKAPLSGRDAGYLRAAAAGWLAWYDVHKHLIEE